MTHRLPVGKTVMTGLDAIKCRPELAAMIGHISNEWNYLERSMESIYALLMGRMYAPAALPVGQYATLSHPIAFQIFDELESFRAKQNLVEALIKWAFQGCPEKYQEYATATEKPIKNAYRSRNSTVHMLWGVCDDYPDALISQPTFGHALVWKMSDFEGELKKVRQGLSAFGQATAKLREFSGNLTASPC